jgi:hypothetical protein
LALGLSPIPIVAFLLLIIHNLSGLEKVHQRPEFIDTYRRFQVKSEEMGTVMSSTTLAEADFARLSPSCYGLHQVYPDPKEDSSDKGVE